MNLYRTKPQTVQAVQVDPHNVQEIARWCRGRAGDPGTGDAYVAVNTPHGTKFANVGSYVVLARNQYAVLSESAFLAAHEPLVDIGVLR